LGFIVQKPPDSQDEPESCLRQNGQYLIGVRFTDERFATFQSELGATSMDPLINLTSRLLGKVLSYM